MRVRASRSSRRIFSSRSGELKRAAAAASAVTSEAAVIGCADDAAADRCGAGRGAPDQVRAEADSAASGARRMTARGMARQTTTAMIPSVTGIPSPSLTSP